MIVLYVSSFIHQFQINKNVQRLEKICVKIANVLMLAKQMEEKLPTKIRLMYGFSRFIFTYTFVLIIFYVNFCPIYFLLWAYTFLAGIVFTGLDTW